MTDKKHSAEAAPCRPLASTLIGLWGLYQVVAGLYFIFVRPSVLPEDLRAAATTLEALRVAAPEFESWLHRVFWVLGGQMAGIGVLLIGAAIRIDRDSRPGKTDIIVFGAAGLFSVLLMSGVNFAIHSDFRWLLVAPVFLWLSSMAALSRSIFAQGSRL